MTLSALARLLMRRWYVAVLGLLLTGFLAAAALQVVKPAYEAAGSILLLPPANPGANPYLDLASVPGVPDVISRVLQDSKYADKYEGYGIKDYEVTIDQSAGGPAVLVVGKGETGDEALTAMRTVMDDVIPVLQELQNDADVAPPNLITARQIYVETEATKVGKAQTRAVIAVIGAGLVLTLFLVAAVDALLARLSGRRRSRRQEVVASVDSSSGASPLAVDAPTSSTSWMTESAMPEREVMDADPAQDIPEPDPELDPEAELEREPEYHAAGVDEVAAPARAAQDRRPRKRSSKRTNGKRPTGRPAQPQQPGPGDRR
ncbi:hypothetical protein [Nocardioides sp. P5_E3]